MKQSDTQQRRNAIVDWVNRQGKVQVDTLAHHFGTSEVTIRKDLSLLANDQRLIRQFGGAVRLPEKAVPVTVSAGYVHTCVLDDSGVKCWGAGTTDTGTSAEFGQSGHCQLQGFRFARCCRRAALYR